MTGLRLIEFAILALMGLTVLMMVLTVGAKALRAVRQQLRKSYYRRLEPALENLLLTGEPQPEIEKLRLWERDSFLSPLMLERMALLRGSGREYLMRMARELGLVEKYLGDLRSRRRWKRAWAAENLGYFGGEEAVSPLAGLLGDDDETVRAVAARALARIATPAAVQALARTMDDPSELTRLRVAENLEKIGRPVVGPLIGLLEDVATPGTHRLHGLIMAARVLGNLRAAEARGVLRKAVRGGGETDIRAQAALALGKIGNPEDVPTLLRATRDRSWPVRAQAANALGMIGEISAVPVLAKLVADEAWWVRLNAGKALANMGPAGEQALIGILRGSDRYARDRAAAILEARGVTGRMVRQLDTEGKKGARARALIGALVESGITRHLHDLAEDLLEGEERQALLKMLSEESRERESV